MRIALEPAQPLRQCGRHVGGAHAFRSGRFRQQQARLEVSEPRRHHQIVGSKLKAHLPRSFDEREILIGKRENGNLREIDFLLAREIEQQVERTFEILRRRQSAPVRRSPVSADAVGSSGMISAVHAPLTCGTAICCDLLNKQRRAPAQRRTAPA